MKRSQAEHFARVHFEKAVEQLSACAEYLRGPDLPAHPTTMRTEIAVSRALDALRGGFKVG